MLGDIEVIGEVHATDKMADVSKKPSETPSPPPAKKLKQARLPFKVLDQKPLEAKPSPVLSKKRKHSDSSTGPQKAPKVQRNNENLCNKITPKKDDAENEVSSSSEADFGGKNLNSATKSEKLRGLERFVQSTQQLEVSTSSEVIDLTDTPPSTPKRQSAIRCDAATTKVTITDSGDPTHKIENKTKDDIPTNISGVGQKDSSKSKDTNESNKPSDKSEKDNNASEVSLDTSTLSNTSADGSDASSMNISVEHEHDKNKTKSEQTPKRTNGSAPKGENTDTPNSKTPSTPAQSIPKRPPSSSAKKQAEMESKRQEREKLKAEKAHQKELEKQKKEELRKEKEEQKEKLRLEKEKQKQEEKERKEAEKKQKEEERQQKLAEKEKEKAEKLKQKEEEKKKKQELLDAKAEEKRKKEEEKENERKRKEEEKQKQEEEKAKKWQQSQAILKGFLKKVDKPAEQPKVTENVGAFAAFQVRENMKMAPLHRYSSDNFSERLSTLDSNMVEQVCNKLYLTNLRDRTHKPGHCPKTWPAEIVEEASSENPTAKMKGKLYQFHENYRPAYFGTWRKRSKNIKPRNPFKKDEGFLDYEVDSDDEWEEEEPGESLSHSEDEGEDAGEGGDDEDDDGFFVPHGYLSDGEGCEDEEEDRDPEKMKMRQIIKARNFEAEMKKPTEVLRTIAIGCCWSGDDNQALHSQLESYKAVILAEETPIRIEGSKKKVDEKPAKDKKPKTQEVPEEAMKDIIRLVHGNIFSLQKLIREFLVFWRRQENFNKDSNSPKENKNETDMETDDSEKPEQQEKDKSELLSCSISKRQLDMRIRSIATYEQREEHNLRSWYVNKDVLEKYGLTDLPVPTAWNWITQPRKKKKIEETSSPSTSAKDPQPTNSSKGSIKRFAVPGLVPTISPAQSNTSSPITPKDNSSQPNKKTPKRITPITLFCAKKDSSVDREKQCLPPPSTCTVNSSNNNNEDDDCMIVDEPFVPPPPSKSQPTLLGMFSAKDAKANVKE